MVRIRLARGGRKKKPFYRVVVAEITSPRDGRFIEKVGTYDPMTNPFSLNFKLDRIDYWLSVGAQPSETVERLLVHARKQAAEAAAAVPAAPAESSSAESSEA